MNFRLASSVLEILRVYGELPIAFLSHITNTEIEKINEVVEELKNRKVVSVHDKMIKINEDVAEW